MKVSFHFFLSKKNFIVHNNLILFSYIPSSETYLYKEKKKLLKWSQIGQEMRNHGHK